jgi:hypothetical protein
VRESRIEVGPTGTTQNQEDGRDPRSREIR